MEQNELLRRIYFINNLFYVLRAVIGIGCVYYLVVTERLFFYYYGYIVFIFEFFEHNFRAMLFGFLRKNSCFFDPAAKKAWFFCNWFIVFHPKLRESGCWQFFTGLLKAPTTKNIGYYDVIS